MIRSEFNDKVGADKMLNSLQKRLGELITDIVGNDRVQALFEAAGKHPAEFEGMSTGEIALKEGVISRDTKTALLVAQAAARTITLADKAERYHANIDNLSEYYKKSDTPPDSKTMGYLSLDDNTFKFVGDERDPKVLIQAQSEWMAAQSYLNTALSEISKRTYRSDWDAMIDNSAGGPDLFKDSFGDGFKLAASDNLSRAATMLAAEGHTQAASLIDTLSDEIARTVKNHASPTPLAFLQKRDWSMRANIGFQSQFVQALGLDNGPSLPTEAPPERRVIALLSGQPAPATPAASPDTARPDTSTRVQKTAGFVDKLPPVTTKPPQPGSQKRT